MVYQTGIRLSELLDLRLDDVNLTKASLWFAGGKPGQDRVVYLTPRLTNALSGKTHKVELDVEYQGMARSPWGTMNAGFSVSTTLNCKNWGLAWNQALETSNVLVGDKLDVDIEVELVKQDVEEAEEEAETAMEAAR